MAEPFRHRLRVRWAECDLQGVVFYPHYLAYMDVAMTELWRATTGAYGEMIAAGADMVVAEANVRYREPARFDDELDLVVGVLRLGTTSMTSSITIERVADSAPLVEGKLRHVFVDPQSLRKREMPDDVRAALGPHFLGPQPEPSKPTSDVTDV